MSTIKEKLGSIKKVIYFSDGAPSQYKNKNHLANIYCHDKDFNIKVTSYNFFASSHGKSLCDAIGGIIKRSVMRYCLRASPEEQITNALQMYEYAVQNCKNIGVLWVPHSEVNKHERKLKRRFSMVKTLTNTRKYHCFIPVEDNFFQAKITSFDDC
ncbi:uncharacterized protein LOC141537857 [Cotesia typhae]|uniref:uncharacterized protein LOC141537857 n=1 Tax=Cotesia typhae TaxID=2053667 RepID=UPI003D69EAF6